MKALKAIPYLLLAAGTAIPMVFSPMKPPSKAPSGGPSAEAQTLTGAAQGMDGDVTVQIVADKDYLYSVEVTDQHETEGIGTIAVDQLPGQIYNYQSYAVDSISGATITSDAIKNAIKAALESGGIPTDKFAEPPVMNTAKARDAVYKADVVVVGAGGAGMTAAIEAADKGHKVIILESQTMVGGNSIRATGGMNAADTKWQDENEFGEGAGVEAALKSAAEEFADNKAVTELAKTVKKQYEEYQKNPVGYFDTAELMELNTIMGGHGINDPALVKELCEKSAEGIDWLDSVGAKLHRVGAAGGASVKRIHSPVNAEGKVEAVGAYTVPILQSNIETRSGKIRLFYSTTADKVLMEDGKAVGVHAKGATGENVTVKAKSVILASGGFGANPKMCEKYRPELKGFMSTNASGAQGIGIQMGEEVGAATVDMEQIQIHPTVEYNSAHLITEGLRGDGAILVNIDGKRFFDEVQTRDRVSAAEIAQPQSFAWLIIDQKMVDASAVIEGYIKAGYTVSGKDAKDLAKQIDVDPDTLDQTIKDWNQCVANKSDPEFGRTSFANPLDTAPYYALKVTPGIHHTMGGLKINPKTEVLKESGEAIPGLFAAGEVTGGVHGGNRLGGTAVTDFIVYGRIAGQQASDYVEKLK
jgi:fumarate reductase flavoprotein subunit